MPKSNHFELPKELIDRLRECTRGFFLVTITDEGKFETFDEALDQADAMAILAYISRYLEGQEEAAMDEVFSRLMEESLDTDAEEDDDD